MKRILDANGNELRRPIGFTPAEPVVVKNDEIGVQSGTVVRGTAVETWRRGGGKVNMEPHS